LKRLDIEKNERDIDEIPLTRRNLKMEIGFSKISSIPFYILAQMNDYEVLPFQTSLDFEGFPLLT
jgi:hypothetical protein